MFGPGKKGLAVTDQGIFYDNDGNNDAKLEWDEFAQAKFRHSSGRIEINDGDPVSSLMRIRHASLWRACRGSRDRELCPMLCCGEGPIRAPRRFPLDGGFAGPVYSRLV